MAKRLIVLLPLALLVLGACTGIGGPSGWSGGTVDGDYLYIGTQEGELVALDLNTGDLFRRFELKGDETLRAIYGTPVVVDGTLYLGGYDGILYTLNLQGEGDLELEPLEGVGNPEERTEIPIVGSPVVVNDLVLVGSSDGNLYAIPVDEEASGWRFPTEGKVWSTPAVADGVAYFGSLDHNIYAVNVEDGTQLWKFPTDGAVAASPVVVGGRVYVGSFDSVFYAIDAATGLEAWRFTGASSWFWGKAVADEGTVYVPSLDSHLYALDIHTGDLQWTLETEGPIVGSPALVDDMIVVPSDDGKVRLARLSDGFVERQCNTEEKIRTSLVVNDGMVYFATRDHTIRALAVTSRGGLRGDWAYLTNKEVNENWVCTGPT